METDRMWHCLECKVYVTASDLEEYLDHWYEILDKLICEHVPPEEFQNLPSAPLFQAWQVHAYLSRGRGIAIEWQVPEVEEGAQLEVFVHEGLGPAEKLLWRMPDGYQHMPAAHYIEGSNWTYSDCGFTNIRPFELGPHATNVRLINTTIGFGDVERKIVYSEFYGNTSAELWTKQSAVNKAQAEVLVFLSDFARAKQKALSLPDFIKTFKAKTVLVLGTYSPAGEARIAAIVEVLRAKDYDPIIIGDLPDVAAQSLEQKVAMYGSIARFVIMDDSEPGGQLLEVKVADSNKWILSILRLNGRGGSMMTAGVSHTSNVISELAYDEAALQDVVNEAIEWAEAKNADLGRFFDLQYQQWRRK